MATALPTAVAQQPVRFDSATISGLPARNIGSAAMSGRIAAVAAVNDNGRLTVFAGSASGGVWKSVNGGTTFKSVFDQPDVQSIGAVAIDPSNPKIVWVGTGETWVRNSVSVGDGIYKSTDGGENWNNVGLKDSEHIAKILIDPEGRQHAFTPAPPGTFGTTTTSAASTRPPTAARPGSKVLAGSNGSTGCGCCRMSPQEPKTIYASMWDFRRQGWTFRSGGPGSGLFKSTDGGEHWTELTDANSQRPAREALWPHRAGGGALQATSGLRHDRVARQRAVTAPMTAARTGTSSTPASTWCGGRSISPTSSSIPRTKTKSSRPIGPCC